MPSAAPEKRLEWAPRALDAYLSTLARIAEEDPITARQFMERVERSLSSIRSHPDIGTEWIQSTSPKMNMETSSSP
jgi:plasmid stabilization system protein ParE